MRNILREGILSRAGHELKFNKRLIPSKSFLNVGTIHFNDMRIQINIYVEKNIFYTLLKLTITVPQI